MRLRSLLISCACVAVLGFGLSGRAEARTSVDVNIGINVPPPFTMHEEPHLVVIPGTYAYYAPDIDLDIVFYGGWWYRPYENRWFRSKSYNGPWTHYRRVPKALLHLPHDYRHAPPVYKRVPYGDVRRHWRKWERDRYWDREEHRRHDGRHDRHDGRYDRHGDRDRHRGDHR